MVDIFQSNLGFQESVPSLRARTSGYKRISRPAIRRCRRLDQITSCNTTALRAVVVVAAAAVDDYYYVDEILPEVLILLGLADGMSAPRHFYW